VPDGLLEVIALEFAQDPVRERRRPGLRLAVALGCLVGLLAAAAIAKADGESRARVRLLQGPGTVTIGDGVIDGAPWRVTATGRWPFVEVILTTGDNDVGGGFAIPEQFPAPVDFSYLTFFVGLRERALWIFGEAPAATELVQVVLSDGTMIDVEPSAEWSDRPIRYFAHAVPTTEWIVMVQALDQNRRVRRQTTLPAEFRDERPMNFSAGW
jgi:hypothetical protein